MKAINLVQVFLMVVILMVMALMILSLVALNNAIRIMLFLETMKINFQKIQIRLKLKEELLFICQVEKEVEKQVQLRNLFFFIYIF